MSHRLTRILPVLVLALVGCGPDPFDGDGGIDVLPECREYEFRDQVYDCAALDRCEETDFAYRLACCECDPRLCDPDPRCTDGGTGPVGEAESCMGCHNGAATNNYSGPGISNPHPFGGEANIACTTCHGGDPNGVGRAGSHVPPPPEIGDRMRQTLDPVAYFNRRTLTGIDRFPDYTTPDGRTYRGLDYLQFVNPGDLRVVADGNGCGTPGCHAGEHGDWVPRSPIGTTSGMLSGPAYLTGIENHIPDQRGLWGDTAAEYGFRTITDPDWRGSADRAGTVGRINQYPERSAFGDRTGIYQNPIYDSNTLPNFVDEYNRILPGTPLEHLVLDAVGITCGDCHGGSAGQNDRYGDFRSSGCTSCHMEYSPDGRTRSTDPNVNRLEPADPDEIAAPERPHIEAHQIRNVARILPNGAFQRGISDYACAGCHQGSNRTVMQYWGIRLDQNADVTNNLQYPANPQAFQDSANDPRLFDPAVNNNTFNGREAAQYLSFEDYDGDNRDDTPPDVHHEAGMGCIDCHGSRDLHNGTRGDDSSGQIVSRMTQAVHIECQSCHGGVGSYASTAECTTYDGTRADCGVDRRGNALRHVSRDADSNYWLVSRLDGRRHYVPQTRDVVVNNNKQHPITRQLLYSPIGSYAMGRADGNDNTGIGPMQTDPELVTPGFSHTDRVDCVACHASWTNNCVGCHLSNEYDANPGNYYFSNITGQRTTTFQAAADFTYITPVPFYLGVNSRGRVAQTAPGMGMFYRYTDLNGVESQVFAFSDRDRNGNNPNFAGRGDFGALGHDAMMPHSIRGRVTLQNEGPRYCVACHLNTESLDNFGAQYAEFRAQMANSDFANLDFELLQQHIGQNTGNQINSPIWVHMVAGLGSGLFLFDENGCPVNPLDENANRHYCPDGAPADNFNANNVRYNLDRLVEATGVTNASSSHPALDAARTSALRAGSLNPGHSGPLGAELIQLLSDPNVGVVLDSWVDANGQAQGDANNHIR